MFVNAISAVRRVAAILKALGLPAHTLHAQQQQRQRLKVRRSLLPYSSNGICVLAFIQCQSVAGSHPGPEWQQGNPQMLIHTCWSIPRPLTASRRTLRLYWWPPTWLLEDWTSWGSGEGGSYPEGTG